MVFLYIYADESKRHRLISTWFVRRSNDSRTIEDNSYPSSLGGNHLLRLGDLSWSRRCTQSVRPNRFVRSAGRSRLRTRLPHASGSARLDEAKRRIKAESAENPRRA